MGTGEGTSLLIGIVFDVPSVIAMAFVAAMGVSMKSSVMLLFSWRLLALLLFVVSLLAFVMLIQELENSSIVRSRVIAIEGCCVDVVVITPNRVLL